MGIIRGVESSAPEVKKRRMATLYVGNLAWSTTAETLTACLAANGTVTNVDTGTVRNGRTRGWAIVECSDQDAANNIIQMCNGQDCDGRTLTVRLDNKPEGNQSKGKGWGTVAFATQEDAIQRFGGVELASRPMVVRMDRFN